MAKRVFFAVLLGFIVGAVAFATGGAEPESAGAEEQITLNWWFGVPYEKGPRQLAEAYEAMNPGINIEYTQIGWDDQSDTKLTTALISGENVDVYAATRSPAAKAERGLAVDLTDFLVADGIDIRADFREEIQGYFVNDRPYGIAITRSSTFFLVNLDMLEEAGLEMPDNDWTIYDFREYAAALTVGTGPNKRYGAYMTSNGTNFWARLAPAYYPSVEFYSDDFKSVNLEDPRMVELLDLYVQMSLVDGSIPTYAECLAENYFPNNVYLPEKAAMALVNDYVLRDLKDRDAYPIDFKSGFVSVPLHPDYDVALNPITVFDTMAISPKTEHLQESWDFLRWAATDGYVHLIPFGRMPTWNGYDPEELAEAMVAGYEDLLDRESFARLQGLDRPSAREYFGSGAPIVNAILSQEAERALTGEVTAAEALRVANERANADLAAAGN